MPFFSSSRPTNSTRMPVSGSANSARAARLSSAPAGWKSSVSTPFGRWRIRSAGTPSPRAKSAPRVLIVKTMHALRTTRLPTAAYTRRWMSSTARTG